MAEKSSSSSSSGIDKALEGEPIIYVDLCCTKGVFAEPGWSSYGQKEYLVWRQIVHLVTKGWSVISTESLPRLVFTELSSVTKPPRPQRHWKSSVSGRSEADDKTTTAKSDDSAPNGAPLAPTELPSDGAHFAHLHSVSSTLWETFFVVAWPYHIKRNVSVSSEKKKKKTVWFCEWAIRIMSGCCWNFFSDAFCKMYSVVTVKTVVNFNHANIFCTTTYKEENKVLTVCHEITNHLPKNRRCRWNKKWKITAMLVNVTKKVF